MGLGYSSDASKRIIYVVWDGTVMADEWHAHIRRMTADPDWPAATRFLADLTSVEDVTSITAEVIEQSAAIYAGIPGKLDGKQDAIVSTSKYAISKAFEQLLLRIGAAVITFYTLDTACVYLGLDLAETQQELAALRAKLSSG